MMLATVTPPRWVDAAVARWQELLVDHANCEKKAASTALSLMFAYPEDMRLGTALARLAREELRHFEQVQKMMLRMGVPPVRLGPGRYAGRLRTVLSNAEPQRRIDLMLCGALIEARSCERFELLAPRLPTPLGDFYGDLALAERRHGELYLTLAREAAGASGPGYVERLEARLQAFARIEGALATEPDSEFRFHSGPPPEARA